MTTWLRTQRYAFKPKRVLRLMRLMCLETIYSKPPLSKRNMEHEVYPYLLENVIIVRPYQVFSTDITYIRLQKGLVYLTSIIDWYSHFVLDSEVSVIMGPEFCCASICRVLMKAIPEIFNTDQGDHYTAKVFINFLKAPPSGSEWMIEVEPWTMFLWNASGGRSNMRKSISMTTACLRVQRQLGGLFPMLQPGASSSVPELKHFRVGLHRPGHPWSGDLVRLPGLHNQKPRPRRTTPRDLSKRNRILFMTSFPQRTTDQSSHYLNRFSVLTIGSTLDQAPVTVQRPSRRPYRFSSQNKGLDRQ